LIAESSDAGKKNVFKRMKKKSINFYVNIKNIYLALGRLIFLHAFMQCIHLAVQTAHNFSNNSAISANSSADTVCTSGNVAPAAALGSVCFYMQVVQQLVQAQQQPTQQQHTQPPAKKKAKRSLKSSLSN
jgi:hypothetical protein